MPRLDDADLDALAALARLDIPPADRGGLRADLQRILDYVDRLAAVDRAPTTALRRPDPPPTPAKRDAVEPADLRTDVPRATAAPELAPADLAPAWRDGRFEVPRTVEADG